MEQPVCIVLEALDLEFSFGLLVSQFAVILILDIFNVAWLFVIVGLLCVLFSKVIPLDHITLKPSIGFALHYVDCVVVDLLLLSYLVWMIDHNIGFYVEFAHIERHILALVQGLLHLLLELVLQVVVDGVLKEVFPFDSLSRIDNYHFP